MSKRYDEYLNQHISNVKKSFKWLREKCPDIFPDQDWYLNDLESIIENHDQSKYYTEEYDAYDKYFYTPGGKSYENVENFKYAWLHHIHSNMHHWQHWILQNDDGTVDILDMPYVYIIEMICDWWSFGWLKDDPYELFAWYNERKDGLQLSDYTRGQVEYILSKIKEQLDNEKKN